MSGRAWWVDQAIWWHVYPLGFVGAPIRTEDAHPGPRLRRLLPWLDYAVTLGVNGLLLGPVSASQTHGYDGLDQLALDPRLGAEADFDDLVEACRERGLRVVLDGVFSHVGSGHPQLAAALAQGPDGPDGQLFDIDWQAPGGPSPRVFEGHGDLVRLNHGSPGTATYVAEVMRAWLRRGIDGWRLDAAYSVDPGFWAPVLAEVRAEYPDAWFLGEVIQGDYPAFVAASGVDSVTQYELWKAVWSSLKDANLYELAWALGRHNDFLATFVPNTFVGNHDVTRIASLVGQGGSVVALAVLMTVGGIPSVYYGDEQGYTGIKQERLGGDDDVRPRFPDSPEQLSTLGAPLYAAHQELIGLRRRHPWLVAATTTVLALDNTHLTYRSTASDGSDFLDVDLDISADPQATVRDSAGQTLWTYVADSLA